MKREEPFSFGGKRFSQWGKMWVFAESEHSVKTKSSIGRGTLVRKEVLADSAGPCEKLEFIGTINVELIFPHRFLGGCQGSTRINNAVFCPKFGPLKNKRKILPLRDLLPELNWIWLELQTHLDLAYLLNNSRLLSDNTVRGNDTLSGWK